jgi:hypothetical protein
MQMNLPDIQPQLPKIRRRLPQFGRVATPPGHLMTERDRLIIVTNYLFGIMADYQVQRLFFNRPTALYRRLSKLFQHRYQARPSFKQRAQLDYLVMYVDKRGVEDVVSQHFKVPLKELPFNWRKPGERWSLVSHDIELNDFRIDFFMSCSLSGFSVLEWVAEDAFRSDTDRITYETKAAAKAFKQFRPDDYYRIQQAGQEHPNRLFLEWDRGTMDINKFISRKVRPYVAYVQSSAYNVRFGHNSGRFMVITTSMRRARHLQQAVEATGLPRTFDWYFTSDECVSSQTRCSRVNLLTDTIWLQPGKKDATVALFRTARRSQQVSYTPLKPLYTVIPFLLPHTASPSPATYRIF